MSEQKYSLLDIDLEEFDKDTLIHLIMYAHQREITFNQAICQILQNVVDQQDAKDQ